MNQLLLIIEYIKLVGRLFTECNHIEYTAFSRNKFAQLVHISNETNVSDLDRVYLLKTKYTIEYRTTYICESESRIFVLSASHDRGTC